ncbi:MAG: hypothetical protein PHR44_08205 [Candidatus Omnitrophica bacterium]|nr:hypothetical protein [Candidatus Omnitrophota bacterium]
MLIKRLFLVALLTLFLSRFNTAFCEIPQLSVSDETLDFGYSYTEKEIAITNYGSDTLAWRAETDVPWIKIEQNQGTIPSTNQLPANAPYQYSNMWPKLPNPWYFSHPHSIGVDHEGYIYVVDTYHKRIKKFNKYGEFILEVGNDNPSSNSYVYYPHHIAFDSENNFYVVTDYNYYYNDQARIKKFNRNGNFITSFKPGSSWKPYDIAVDSQDNIYVTDYENFCVHKFGKNGNYIKRWGSFRATLGYYGQPIGIVIDSGDYIYIADNHYMRIWKFDSDGNYMKRWGFETSNPNHNSSDYQYGEVFAIDSKDVIYIGHEHKRFLGKFDTEGRLIQSSSGWNIVDFSGNYIDFHLHYTGDVAIDEDGNIYMCPYSTPDELNTKILKFNSQGRIIAEWGSYNKQSGDIFYNGPLWLDVDKKGNIYIGSAQNTSAEDLLIQKFGIKGGLVKVKEWSVAIPSVISDDITLDLENNIYIPYFRNVFKFDNEGNLIKEIVLNNQFHGQDGRVENIAIDSENNMYISDPESGEFLIKYDSKGDVIEEWDMFTRPYAIAITSQDIIYAAYNRGHSNDRYFGLAVLNQDGDLIDNWTLDQLNDRIKPWENNIDITGIACDSHSFVYLVLDNGEIYKFDQDGNSLFYFGRWGTWEGEFKQPNDIAVDTLGNMYISDAGNNRIQVFSQASAPVKISIDRKQLSSTLNAGTITFYNESDVSQEPISVTVSARSEFVRSVPRIGGLSPDWEMVRSGEDLTLTATYLDNAGWQDLQDVYLFIGDSPQGNSGAQLRYNVSEKRLYSSGEILLINWAGALGEMKESGRMLQMVLSLRFVNNGGRNIRKKVFLRAIDKNGDDSGWKESGLIKIRK